MLKDTEANENISSAEMTAYWRCRYPSMSGDTLSETLATPEGIKKAIEFEQKYNYPLVGRKVSVRAGWCLKEATQRLLTGKYDACISLGSGFSLLTYYVALAIEPQNLEIKFFDIDLPEIINQRKRRIANLPVTSTNLSIIKKIIMMAIDLEAAYQQGRNFSSLFPTCKAPVFIIEGIIYFLTKNCAQWIYDGISSYKNSAVVFDYWPQESINESACFKRVIDSLNNFIPEQIRGFISHKELAKLCRSHVIKDIDLQDAEKELSEKTKEPVQLKNKDEFIPVRLAVCGAAPPSKSKA
jgi:hypothetical protein